MDALLATLVGLVGLVVGGELLVRGAVSAARSFGISPMVIGLTLVGFGTSSPELVASLEAALSGAPDIAVGNVIGSNIGNILLILGVTALLAPVIVDPASFKRDGAMVSLATLMCLGVVLIGDIGRVAGAVFLLTLAAYLTFTLVSEKRRGSAAAEMYEGEADIPVAIGQSVGVSLLIALAGLAITIVGAKFLISGAVSIAAAAGLSEAVIGLTVVAIGTSMPELVTSIIAVRKGQGDVALGNVLGSNLFNILGILGVTAIVQPMRAPPEIASFDIWVMCAATALMVFFARTGWRVGRREGGLMLALYAAYLAWLVA